MNSVPSSPPTRPTPDARALIRPSSADDMPAVSAICRWHVENGDGTFELHPPSAAEMSSKRPAVLDGGLLWVVAERCGVLQGYAYAAPFRACGGYRHCLEDSVYVANDACGQGLGRLLLAELRSRCEAVDARQTVALIGDVENRASIALHRGAGFRDAGVLQAAGWKHQRWLDVVLMQKRLGRGAMEPPLVGPPSARAT